MFWSWFSTTAWLPFLYTAGVAIILLALLFTTLSNWVFFPRLYSRRFPESDALVSILIPARNEGGIIGDTVYRILSQSYTHFELLVLDDNSTDETAAIVRNWQERDPRVKLLSGQPLPNDWLGKNWACHQLAQAAEGDMLIFIDADVQWRRYTLASILALQAETKAALLTVWPTQILASWAEFFVVPLMKFSIVSYLPILGVHFTPFTAFAAANGQCLSFSRQAYELIGGHAAVRQEIIEDVMLAKAIKRAGLRLWMADGARLVSCHMYRGWTAVRRGFGKNILAGHGNSVLFLLFSAVFHWAVFVGPWIWLIFGGGGTALALGGLALLLRGLSEWVVNRRLGRTLFMAVVMPIGVFLMTLIAWQALQWHFGNGPEWKGRTLQKSEAKVLVKDIEY